MLYAASMMSWLVEILSTIICNYFKKFHQQKVQQDLRFLSRSVRWRSQINFLGYNISKNGLRLDPAYVVAIKMFPRPNTVKEIKSFVIASTHYRSFIKVFSALAEPLLRLARKDVKYEWSYAQEKSFERLKELRITAPIL